MKNPETGLWHGGLGEPQRNNYEGSWGIAKRMRETEN